MNMQDNRFLKKTIEKALRDLPPMPTVVSKILEETEKQEVNAHEIERLITSDQALAIKVLRVVNSAYYGLSRQISSLNQAIVILGVQQIRNLVLSFGALQSLKPKNKEEELAMQRFWKHSFGAAAVAQMIFKQKRFSLKEAELASVGALLHDIGKLFLYIHFGDTYLELVQYAIENQVKLEDAEVEFLGLTHGELGGEMARVWKLPDNLVEVIEKHEGKLESTTEYQVHRLVQFADAFCKHIYYTDGPTPILQPSEELCDWIDLSPDALAELEEIVKSRIEEACSVLGLAA